MLGLEQLEARENPAVHFTFHTTDDPFFTPEVKAALEVAGRAVGESLSPTALPTEIPVSVGVSHTPIAGALAFGGPSSSVLGKGAFFVVDGTEPWHFGKTVIGLDFWEIDFVTIASHELLHGLGVGTTPDWDAGSRERGVAISADRAHFGGSVRACASEGVAQFGRRLTPTGIDRAALTDLGWNATPAGGPNLTTLSIAGPDGTVRVFLAAGPFLLPLATLGQFHLQFQDFDFDGRLDLRAVSSRPGFDVIYRLDGSVIDAGFTFGVPLLVTRYGE